MVVVGLCENIAAARPPVILREVMGKFFTPASPLPPPPAHSRNTMFLCSVVEVSAANSGGDWGGGGNVGNVYRPGTGKYKHLIRT
jgi:hypothetical protein